MRPSASFPELRERKSRSAPVPRVAKPAREHDRLVYLAWAAASASNTGAPVSVDPISAVSDGQPLPQLPANAEHQEIVQDSRKVFADQNS